MIISLILLHADNKRWVDTVRDEMVEAVIFYVNGVKKI